MITANNNIIVGDFNIHVDVDDNSLGFPFKVIVDSIGFTLHVNEPTPSFVCV